MSSPFQIEFNNQQSLLPIDVDRLRDAITAVLTGEGIVRAEVSVAILDDRAIHTVNRDQLDHDYPTDILSFLFERDAHSLDGELIASAETAIRSATEVGWPAEHELALYLVHGTLHLAGYNDYEDADRAEMRKAERQYLQVVGMRLPNNGFARTSFVGDELP